MTTRTERFIVRFSSPFRLYAADGVHPAGDYAVDQDEQLIEGITWLAYQRVATFIHLPAITSGGGKKQLVPVDPSELAGAVRQDPQSAGQHRALQDKVV